MSFIETTQSNAGTISQSGFDDVVRIFRVSGVTSAVAATLEPGLPIVNEAYPGDPRLRAVRWRPEPVPDGVDVWDVFVTYDNIEGSSGSHQPRKTKSRKAELIQAWRVSRPPGNAIVFPGTLTAPTQSSDGDIGGISVDTAGVPLDFGHAKHIMRFTYPIIGSADDLVITALMNRRNTKSFKNYRPGYVVYLGADDEYIGNGRYLLTHEFVWDDVAHLRQVPVTGDDGQMLLSESGAGFARYVNHYQPFPLTGDFAALRIPPEVLKL